MTERTTSVVPVAILLAALIALGAMTVGPWVHAGWLGQRIVENERTLSALEDQIATAVSAGALANGRSDPRHSYASLLLGGHTAGIAGANLQKMMNDLVLLHGGAAQSFQILPPKEQGGLMRISVRLSISVGTDALREILHKLETGRPLIFVDALTMRVPQKELQTSDRHYLGPLDVTMQLGAFAATEKAL